MLAFDRTVWKIKQRTLVDMAADRGCFIDQSQSLNIHMDQPNFGKLTSPHFYAWNKGLKTGMYYLRTRAAADAIKFTVDTSMLKVKLLWPHNIALTKNLIEFICVIVCLPYKMQESSKTAAVEEDDNTKLTEMVCSLTNREECMACGS